MGTWWTNPQGSFIPRFYRNDWTMVETQRTEIRGPKMGRLPVLPAGIGYRRIVPIDCKYNGLEAVSGFLRTDSTFRHWIKSINTSRHNGHCNSHEFTLHVRREELFEVNAPNDQLSAFLKTTGRRAISTLSILRRRVCRGLECLADVNGGI